MFTLFVISMVTLTLLGLWVTQIDATERDLAFLIKYHDIYHDSTH